MAAHEMQFKLDAAIVTNPINWQETTLSLIRDEFGAIYYNTPSEYTFWDSGWTALSNLYDTGICTGATFELLFDQDGTGFTNVFTGATNPGIVDYDLDNQRAKATINETDFQQLIKLNKDIKVHIGVGRSKNDTSYTGATKRTIDLFNPATGGYALLNVESYMVADALEDIVSFMTDDTVGLTNNVTEFDTLCICSGTAIDNPGGAGSYKPAISFSDLMEDLQKLYNVGYYIDVSGPDLVIDYYDQIYDTTNNITVTTAFKVNRYIDQSRLYSRVDLGSTKTQSYDGGAFSWPDIRFTSHKSEQYHLEGNCNTGTVLDLVCKNLIIDSNVFEDQVINSAAATPLYENKDEVFCFDSNGAFSQAVRYDIFNLGVAPYSYNEPLTNANRALRFDGVIPNDLLTYLGNGNDYFEATKTVLTPDTAPVTIIAPVDYSNVVSDPNANYDNAAGQMHYTAPVDGFYRFTCSIDVSNVTIDPVGGVALDVQLTLQRRPTGGGAPIETKSDSQIITTAQTVTFLADGFYMNSGEEMNVNVRVDDTGPGPGTNIYDLDGGAFECIEATTGGGIFASFDIADTNLVIYEGSFPLTYSDFISVRDNPTEALTINLPDGTTKKGWAQTIDYDLNSGRAQLKMITNQNL